MAVKPQPEIVVLGARGQLGQAFLGHVGPAALGLDREQLELGDAAALERVLLPLGPRVVINASAYNDVDGAETHRRRALDANAGGPAQLARLARREGWRLVHFSTDYVFGGDGLNRPRTEADPPAPTNFYGYSKLLGEQGVLAADPTALVLRVAHLYGGPSLSPGRVSLADRFAGLARAGQPIIVTQGQWLNPTSVAEIVRRTLLLLERGQAGLFHCVGGNCPVEDFVREILRLTGLTTIVRLAGQDARPARRALDTRLDNRRWHDLGLPPLPAWRDSLAAYLSAAIVS